MTTLFDLYLSIVHWFLDASLTVLEYFGLGGGYLHRFVTWLLMEADVYLAALLAALVLLVWTVFTAGFAAWVDRRVRARAQGRAGPRHVGSSGLLQGLADWSKLFLKRRNGMPSAVPAGVSGALVIAALALMPLGPWAILVDPEWGLVVAAGLIGLSPLPMAAAAPHGQRHAQLAEAAGTGVVLMLAVSSMLLIGGSAQSGALVELQAQSGWGLMLSPLGFLLLLVVMTWESDRMSRARRPGSARERWPGPHVAMGLYSVSARYLALGILGAVLFLGGWSGPIEDGMWWTLLKTYVLVAFTSMVAGSLPLGRPSERASSVRSRWLPLATVNLVVMAAVMEVMG
jgi:NADH-quinone oxidoreductase subunit H